MIAGWMLCLMLAAPTAGAVAATGDKGKAGGEKVLIGQVAGLTGAVAGSVKEQVSGAQVYFKAVNDKGGIAGRQIELRVEDDGFDPKRTPDAARKLIAQGVTALFMVRGTGNTESILPLLDKEGVPLVAPATGAASLHQPVRRWVFNVRAPYQMEVAAAVRHLTTLHVNRLAMFHVDDAFGSDALEGFNKGLAQYGQKAALVQSYKRPAGDISKAVKAFVQAAPGAVIVVGSASETANFIRQFRAAGGAAQLITLSNNAAQSFYDDLGKAGSGVIITQVVPDSGRVNMNLAQEYRKLAKEQGQAHSDAGMEGFMAAKVLVEGLRRAGNDVSRDKLRSALESIRDFDIGGIAISYGPNDHTGSQFVETSIISSTGRLLR
ncbi:MAG: ABC transporter permease [Rhodocyclales bacterium GT-UBC]|nr:MAG: ABC transporter permease [Rhodocyclales bacterium GT-UBC]